MGVFGYKFGPARRAGGRPGRQARTGGQDGRPGRAARTGQPAPLQLVFDLMLRVTRTSPLKTGCSSQAEAPKPPSLHCLALLSTHLTWCTPVEACRPLLYFFRSHTEGVLLHCRCGTRSVRDWLRWQVGLHLLVACYLIPVAYY